MGPKVSSSSFVLRRSLRREGHCEALGEGGREGGREKVGCTEERGREVCGEEKEKDET